LKLSVILYSDDTVILSESESDLQAQLDAFHEYCLTWKLKENKENKNGDKFSPCLTPLSHAK
jgi:hypothetical protein